MFKLWRINLVAVGFCVIALASGCDKKGSTVAAVSGEPSAPPTPPPPKANPGEYGKKLVGIWEFTEDIDGKPQTVSVEFKSDGGFKIDMGLFDMKGTWKLIKEEGKTVTVSTETTIEGFGDAKAPPKTLKQTLLAVFEDANTVVISNEGPKPDPKKFKRKS